MGAYPDVPEASSASGPNGAEYAVSSQAEGRYELLASILESGVTTFMSLQGEYHRLRSYQDDVINVLEELHAEAGGGIDAAGGSSGAGGALAVGGGGARARGDASPREISGLVRLEELSFVHVPIIDCSITSDEITIDIADDVIDRMRGGQCVYLHCWGGHGRAGTVASIVLGRLYEVGAREAMARCQLYHDQRVQPLGVPSPQTETQRDQVRRVLLPDDLDSLSATVTWVEEAPSMVYRVSLDELWWGRTTADGVAIPPDEVVSAAGGPNGYRRPAAARPRAAGAHRDNSNKASKSTGQGKGKGKGTGVGGGECGGEEDVNNTAVRRAGMGNTE
eukprot:g4938.t1